MERLSEWNGMILHLFRQVDSSVHSSNTIKELTDGEIHTYTAFGNYDRLCFTPACRFVDYMKRSENAYRWIGGHKDIMLYPVKSSGAERHFSFEHVGEKQMNLGMIGKNKRRFLIMTMLFVSSEVKEKLADYRALLERCDTHVGKMVEKFNHAAGYSEENSVFGEVFGTFNSAEMCILWGADQFTDVQYLVDQIRYLFIKGHKTEAVPLFASSYTIVSMYQNISDILMHGPVKGGAMIQLASASLRHTSSVDTGRTPTQYLADLKGNEEDHPCELYDVEACSGEYDFLLNTRPPRLDLFEKSDIPGCQNLHYKNEYYRAHFSSTTTRLYYDKRDIPSGLETVDWVSFRKIDGTGIWKDEYAHTVGDIPKSDKLLFGKEGFDEYENLLTNSINDVSSMGTNLRLFYSDYMRALHMTPDRQWTKDLEYQVKTAIDALQAIAIDDNNPKRIYVDRRYIEWAERLLQTLRHQIHHITEAGKFTFEEPSLRANSTVEYDLLFHMFYGAAKEILSCIYDRNKGKSPAKQSSLVPVIKFQPTPIIESELWFDNDRVDKRLLDITIPYDAWGEPQFFIPYLVHEFYHYVAPMDRNIRNEFFAKFLLCEIYRNTIQEYLYSTYEPYLKASKINGKKFSDTDLERVIVEFADMLRNEMFKIIGAPDLSITEKMIKDHCSDEADIEQMLRLQTIKNGDANWSVYKEAFLFWCSCLGGETEEESNGTGFMRKVIAESVGVLRDTGKILPSDDRFIFCDILSMAIGIDKKKDKLTVTAELIESVTKKTENVLSVLKQSLEILSDDSGVDTAPKKHRFSDDVFDADSYPISAELLKNLRTQSEICLHQSIRGLREIFPDYAMVTLCELGVKEYLLLFAVFQDKCFTIPTTYGFDDVSTLRVGCIIDHLLKKEKRILRKADITERRKSFEKYREEFAKLYSGYCSFCGWSDWDKRQTKQDIARKADDWFDEFVARLTNYYSCYGVYENLFGKLTSECFEPLCSKRNSGRISSITKEYFKALGQKNAKPLFKASLAAIGRLQPQKNLYEMSPAAPNTQPGKAGAVSVSSVSQVFDSRRQNRVRWVMRAENMQEILQSIADDLQEIHRKHFKVQIGPNGLWYRGVSNSEYGILPSAMVHFLDQDQRPEKDEHWEIGKNSMGMLWEYQYRLLQRFKYQADGVGEMINSASYKMTDYLALMQHYSQNTCYLDWSEEAFSSLYFALERFVIQDPKRGEDKNHASLFVLDPMLYNRARAKMVDRLLKKQIAIKNTALRDQNALLIQEPEGSIIDISLKWNLQKYSIFTMEDPTVFRDMSGSDPFVKTDKPLDRKKADHATLANLGNEEEVLNLPLAVHTSRLNPRIRKQSGQFMVYSYMSRPVYKSDEKENPKHYVRSADRFDYLALQRIQDYFLKTFNDEYPFMYELRIHTDAKESLAAYLRSAGINRFGIYPELDNLKL